MSIEELCERLLAYMAQLTQQRGHQRGIQLDGVARERWGIQDRGAVQSALEGLVGQGYAKDLRISGCVMAQLTAKGLARYENGGEVFLSNGHVFVDKSATFHGPISNSNIAVHSRDARQIHLGSAEAGLLDQIETTLRHDPSLSEELKREALSDTDFLRREFARKSPRSNVVQQLLSSLGNFSSIAGFVIQLGQLALG